MKDEFLNLLFSIKSECDSNGVVYDFPNTNKVSYPGFEDMKVSGFFDDNPRPILACAIGKPDEQWAQILIHESCHMDQWIQGSEFWKKIRSGKIYSDLVMDKWLSGKEFDVEVVEDSIRNMLALELDCEKRSAQKILKMNLPIDVEKYIKGANSYLYFYPIMLKTRKWCDVAPYEVDEIMDMMPSEYLDIEEYYNFSDDLLEIYKKFCYNN